MVIISVSIGDEFLKSIQVGFKACYSYMNYKKLSRLTGGHNKVNPNVGSVLVFIGDVNLINVVTDNTNTVCNTNYWRRDVSITQTSGSKLFRSRCVDLPQSFRIRL